MTKTRGSRASSGDAQRSHRPGVVYGRPLVWLQIEALATAVAAVVVFGYTHQPWWLVPLLLLVPDLFALGYLAGPKVGAWLYNLAHSAPLPLALLGGGVWRHNPALSVGAAIGLLHIGLDRAMKFGLKYDHGFGVTHMGTNADQRKT